MLDIIVFNVELGQCIFCYPRGNPEYGMLVDCGNTQDFEPVDFLLEKNLIPADGQGHYVSNLTLTNYDHDHFSGLPYLLGKTRISTVRFARNLTSSEIVAQKPEMTDALTRLCALQDTYIHPAPQHQPPYTVTTFSLNKSDFQAQTVTTNNLSQIVFVGYGGSTVCICGDVEATGWEKLLAKPGITQALGQTSVLVAAHHGRDNGYADEVFGSCTPECIVISDKAIVHDTQEGMAQIYATHVLGAGVAVNGSSMPRKVLTTRSDGHIWIRFLEGGGREYRTL